LLVAAARLAVEEYKHVTFSHPRSIGAVAPFELVNLHTRPAVG